MADLENMLLEAAGRTGRSNNRKNTSRSQKSRRHNGSYSDNGSDSRDDDSDNHGPSRKHSASTTSHKKRFDPKEKDSRAGREGHQEYISDSDSDSGVSVGSDLYKDDADREKLSKLSELQRELILTERSMRRDDKWLKKKARASSSSKNDKRSRKETPPPLSRSGRLSAKSDRNAAKDDALNELRAKRMKHHDPIVDRRSKETNGGGVGIGGSTVASNACDSSPMRRKTRSMAASSSDSSSSESEDKRPARGNLSAANTDMIDSDEDSDKVTFEDIKEITIRRSKLAKWFMEPFFEELIVGCFVRVGIGRTRSGQSIYRLCMVKNVDATDPNRRYQLENKTTHKYLNCVWGSDASAARWQMAMISDGRPLLEEFNALEKELEHTGGWMVAKEDVVEKVEAIEKINKFVYSAATVKQMLQEKKSASSRPLNVAAEKNLLRKEMEVAESRGNESEIKRIQTKLNSLENMSRQIKGSYSKAMKLEEMNRKNRAENFKNASEIKPVNTSLKAGEAGYDPFSRRWTRSRNYFNSKTGGVVIGEGGILIGNGNETIPVQKTEAALQAAAGAGKLVDTHAPVDKGTVSNVLHNFELPISLSGLQRLGGAEGVHSGFMARKQKIESTFGYRVPENDGRRHALTLTVSDYKRRRGLL